MSRFGIGGGGGGTRSGGDGPTKPPHGGVVDIAEARALLQREELEKVAQVMQREGHPPDAIHNALHNKNIQFSTPASDDALAELVAKYAAGYVPRLAKVDMAGFMATIYPAPRFVVDLLIPRNEVTLGGGHGGSGKSILFLAMAAHVACGKEWAEFKVEKSRVVFVTLEDSAEHVMHRLQKIICEYLFTPDEVAEIERNLIVIDGTSSPELMIEFNEFGTRRLLPTQMMREVEAAVEGAGLIIIDNASDAFGGNENVRRDVSTFIRHLAGIARANDAGLVILAHIDKAAARGSANGNSYSGSTQWHNAARSRLAMVDVDGQLQLHHEKFNRSRQADPVYLTWTANGVLIPGRSATAAANREELAKTDRDAVLRAMFAAQQLGRAIPSAMRGPTTAFSALEPLPEMETFWNKNGKRRFNTAVLSLQADKMLAQNEEWNDQRNRRAHLELTALGLAAARRLS